MAVGLQLNTYKLTRLDDQKQRIIKNLFEINGPLTELFNSPIRTRIISDDYKRENITVILKKGCRYEQGNYKPICRPSEIGKTLERLI